MIPIFIRTERADEIRQFEMLLKASAKTWIGLPKTFSTKGLYDILGTDADMVRNFIMKQGKKDKVWKEMVLQAEKLKAQLLFGGGGAKKDLHELEKKIF